MTIEWIACEARTGRVITELPDLSPTGPLKRSIGRADSLSFTLPWASMPIEWKRATKPGATTIVALENNEPIYGCLILRRRITWAADADTMPIDATTIEGYFDRRYVGSVDLRDVGQNDIGAFLVNTWVKDGATPGIAIRTDTGGRAGKLRRRSYRDSADKTVGSTLADLSGVLDGPEWTVEWEYTAGARPTYTPVFTIGDRIGFDPPRGLAPVTFDLPGCLRSAELVDSYEAGKGANRVTATGEKSGDDRAQLAAQSLVDPDLPLFELRGSVSTSNSDDSDDGSLAEHAAAALKLTARGQQALSMVAEVQRAPRLSTSRADGTWQLGDTIRADLASALPRNPTREDLARQRKFKGDFRCIAWERDTLARPETVVPTLLIPEAVL